MLRFLMLFRDLENSYKRPRLPWVPEVSLARFPMSVHRAREKNSGTQGRPQQRLPTKYDIFEVQLASISGLIMSSYSKGPSKIPYKTIQSKQPT